MDLLKDLFWKIFEDTGKVESYIAYKEFNMGNIENDIEGSDNKSSLLYGG